MTMEAKQFTKKPVTIEAMQWTGLNRNDILNFCPDAVWKCTEGMVIRTLEGQHIASDGDWILKGVKGEFYPCKPDIFEATYSPAEPSSPEPSGEEFHEQVIELYNDISNGMCGSYERLADLLRIEADYKRGGGK